LDKVNNKSQKKGELISGCYAFFGFGFIGYLYSLNVGDLLGSDELTLPTYMHLDIKLMGPLTFSEDLFVG
jgi:hypothetical protein